MVDFDEYNRITNEANEAKDRLYNIVQQLEEIGKKRKANSLMTIIHSIERWQNTQ